ncbi:HupE/UreJ family protein, partial [Micrococcus sp. SIMBA_131]
AAVFHGLAYGEAIIGAETGPLGAYLLGFSVIQMAIAGAAFVAGKWALSRGSSALLVTRNVGASLITGVGLTALFTSIAA